LWRLYEASNIFEISGSGVLRNIAEAAPDFRRFAKSEDHEGNGVCSTEPQYPL